MPLFRDRYRGSIIGPHRRTFSPLLAGLGHAGPYSHARCRLAAFPGAAPCQSLLSTGMAGGEWRNGNCQRNDAADAWPVHHWYWRRMRPLDRSALYLRDLTTTAPRQDGHVLGSAALGDTAVICESQETSINIGILLGFIIGQSLCQLHSHSVLPCRLRTVWNGPAYWLACDAGTRRGEATAAASCGCHLGCGR